MSSKTYSLEEVTYYFSDPKTIEVLGAEGPESVKVYPTFPVPTERKDHTTALRWAASRKKNGQKTTALKTGNEPISGGRIAALSVRGQGGRAVRTIIEVDGKKLLVDMREAEFYPEILINGLDAGGYLRGEFAWVVNGGGHMTLIRHNSPKWAAAEAQAIVRKSKPIKAKELEFGKGYRTLGGNSYIYLGRIKNPRSGKKCFCFVESEFRYEGRTFSPLNSEAFEKQAKERFSEISEFATNDDLSYAEYSFVNVVLRPSIPKLIAEVPAVGVASFLDGYSKNEDDFVKEFQQTVDEQDLIFRERVEVSKLSKKPTKWGRMEYKSVPLPAWVRRANFHPS